MKNKIKKLVLIRCCKIIIYDSYDEKAFKSHNYKLRN